jgi:hypothetical protein
MSQITKMMRIADRKGYSKQGSWRVDKFRGRYELRHYGTLILRVTKSGKPTYVGGYSKSDVDGINHVFRMMGVPYYATHAYSERTLKAYDKRYGKPVIKNRAIKVYRARR